MSRRWLRCLGVVVVVLVAMGLGRLITDHIPLNVVASAAFVHSGKVGEPIRLRYADVTVTDVRAARALTTTSAAAAPAGVFLVLAVKAVGRGSDQIYHGFDVVDATGVHYVPTVRGGCATNVEGRAGVPSYALICYDVPRRALAGAHLQFALGAYDNGGAAQRRDDVADVDLGIGAEEAARMWRTNDAYKATMTELTPPDLTPSEAPKAAAG